MWQFAHGDKRIKYSTKIKVLFHDGDGDNNDEDDDDDDDYNYDDDHDDDDDDDDDDADNIATRKWRKQPHG